MIKMKGMVIAVLVVALIALGSFAGSLFYAAKVDDGGSRSNKEVYYSAEQALLTLFGDEGTASKSKKTKNVHASSKTILTQRVTVTSDEEVLPYSGTVTKVQDAFYPGTYEIEFSTNAILNNTASIEVQMDVNKGEEVYILTGNKDAGYTEYAVVTVDTGNVVKFDTDVLQTYTLSTTDISAAQKAMADIKGEP